MTADGFSFDLNDWYNGFDGGKAEFTDDNTAVYTTTDYNGNGKLENTFTLKMENDRPVIQVTNKMIEEAPDGEGTEAPIVAEGKYYISYSWENRCRSTSSVISFVRISRAHRSAIPKPTYSITTARKRLRSVRTI